MTATFEPATALSHLRFLLRIVRCFHEERPKILRLLAIIGLSTLTGLAAVWPMALLVDTVLVAETTSHSLLPWLPASWQETRPAQILALGALVFLLRMLQELLGAWRGLLGVTIGHAGMLRLRGDLFAKLQELNVLFHRSQSQGDTILRLTRDTAGCQHVLNVLIEVIVAAFTLVVILAVMVSRSIPLTFVALAAIPLLLATNVLFGRALQSRSRLARSAESHFLSSVQRAVSAINLMQAFGRQQDEHRFFSSRSRDSLDTLFEMHRQLTYYRICVGLIFGAGTALIFSWGGWMAWNDQILGQNPNGMTVGSLVVFISYLGMLYDPLCKLSGAGANMLEGVTGMERVFEVLDRESVICDSPNAQPLPLEPRTLALENVNFAYDPAKPVLRNISLEIPPGEMVAFVGSSGGGKSTILQLLGRFFDPSSGALTIDGWDLRDVKLSDLRRHVAFVFQDNLLLPTTLSENIAYGRTGASPEEIRTAAEMAGIADFIESLPHGFQTEIAEGGQNLSGGQKQRIAIARALLTEAPIIVMDEPTSALDLECEQLVIQTLRQLKGRRTIVLVSHRMSAVMDCDRILVMQEGRVVGSGAYGELVATRRLPRFEHDAVPEEAASIHLKAS